VRRLLSLAAALGAALALASCGSGGGKPAPSPPQGPPSARHPASQIDAALAGEEMRAHLISASRLYFNGLFKFASDHMATVQQQYSKISAAVRSRDSALDREFHAAFGLIAGQIGRRLPAPVVMDRMGLMQGQLLDAAIGDSVTAPAQNDPGVTAEVIVRLAEQGSRSYAVAASEGFTDRGKRAYQDAFGLIARAATLSHRLSKALGPQSNRVTNALDDAHNTGFPTGIRAPRKMPAQRVSADVQRARAGIALRFGFAA
jgi:hypothetical protein